MSASSEALRSEPMSDEPSGLRVVLDAEDESWLAAEAAHLGVDSATLARMMLRQARLGPSRVVATPQVHFELPVHPGLEQHADGDTAGFGAPVEESAEPSLDQLMQAAPSLLDEAFAASNEHEKSDEPDLFERQAALMQAAAERSAAYRPAAPRPQPYGQPAYAGRANGYGQGLQLPGSRTRIVGANPDIAHGTYTGDYRGNIMRENFRHFGYTTGRG